MMSGIILEQNILDFLVTQRSVQREGKKPRYTWHEGFSGDEDAIPGNFPAWEHSGQSDPSAGLHSFPSKSRRPGPIASGGRVGGPLTSLGLPGRDRWHRRPGPSGSVGGEVGRVLRACTLHCLRGRGAGSGSH